MMSQVFLAAAIATSALPAAASTDNTAMTLYRSDNSALYSSTSQGAVDAGYAIIHEPRRLDLRSGKQTVNIDGLPTQVDSEALHLGFASDAPVQVLARRILLPGDAGILATHIGDSVTVIGTNGQSLARGTLLAVGPNLVIGHGDKGGTTVIHKYASVQLQDADVRGGARLQVSLDSKKAGNTAAQLSYPTSGIGWRAAYTGVLSGADDCQLQFSADASIANRSGRDWHNTALKLVAGEPNFARHSGPRPQMMKSMAASAMPAPDALPQQAALGDYRSYTLQHAVDLPDNSITQVPLYATRKVTCQRTWLYENGSAWTPPRPMLARNFNHGSASIGSRIRFTAFDSLPAGYLRVLGIFNGQREFLGEARINDTPKDQPVDIELGNAFDLRGEREQTAFNLDKAAHTLDESYRITISNAGEQARNVTVREHPNRWRNWTLVSSSSKPTKKSTDTLEFTVKVPANGEAHLDYALRYQWTAQDQ